MVDDIFAGALIEGGGTEPLDFAAPPGLWEECGEAVAHSPGPAWVTRNS